MTDRVFDVIVVGAGSAGCALAGRLSEASDRSVLLVEAGPDVPPDREPREMRDSCPMPGANSSFRWRNLVAEVGPDPGDGHPRVSRGFAQGFGVGGSSNIAGMVAMRGDPEDYDEWQNLGVVGWGWVDVLPYFNRLEHDLDFSGPLHGRDGPVPIRRIPPQDWAPFSKAVGDALTRRGYALVEDCNADFREGVSPMPMSNFPDHRVSAARAYLTGAVRQRSNLTILADARAELLDIRDARVTGVTVRSAAGRERIEGYQTVVACGAIQTPSLLMRSGIGPGSHLASLGIDVVRDLPGVGRNLQNHPEVGIAVHLPRWAEQPASQRGVGQHCLRYSSKFANCTRNDMFMVTLNRGSWHALGRRVGRISVYVYKSYSQGTVELTSRHPESEPRVRFDLLSDTRDFDRVTDGLRLVLELLASPEVSSVRNDAFIADFQLVMRLNKRNWRNRVRTHAIATLLELAPLRRLGLRNSALDVISLAQDEDAIARLVRRHAQPVHHATGTCRMGHRDDSAAVIDSQCRVRGIDGLRVVDASIFPTIMRGNTHLPVLMAAEKIADEIKAEWSRSSEGCGDFIRARVEMDPSDP